MRSFRPVPGIWTDENTLPSNVRTQHSCPASRITSTCTCARSRARGKPINAQIARAITPLPRRTRAEPVHAWLARVPAPDPAHPPANPHQGIKRRKGLAALEVGPRQGVIRIQPVVPQQTTTGFRLYRNDGEFPAPVISRNPPRAHSAHIASITTITSLAGNGGINASSVKEQGARCEIMPQGIGKGQVHRQAANCPMAAPGSVPLKARGWPGLRARGIR